jgi:hypothetical protein
LLMPKAGRCPDEAARSEAHASSFCCAA